MFKTKEITTDEYLDVIKWKMVRKTGWTIDYIDSLPLGRLYRFVQIDDGLTKAQG